MKLLPSEPMRVGEGDGDGEVTDRVGFRSDLHFDGSQKCWRSRSLVKMLQVPYLEKWDAYSVLFLRNKQMSGGQFAQHPVRISSLLERRECLFPPPYASLYRSNGLPSYAQG